MTAIRLIKPSILAVIFLFGPVPAYALQAVTVVHDQPGATFHAEDIAKFSEQIEQMKAQVTQLQQTYSAITGSSGVGQLFQNPQLKAMLPADWQNVYNNVENGGYAGISGKLASISATEKNGFGATVDEQQDNIIRRE